MASKPTPARAHLELTLANLPKKPSDWTPEQRSQYATAADKVTQEEAGIRSPQGLPSGKKGGLLRRRR
ncbi:hypothetical protein ACFY3G_02760 [Streptomyces phaeochromogenes]|uniref:hypothetical protein n=1 Tax=Streptomyces phaeochromogenes TaxID=1923 RepID=UPI003679681A